MLASTAVSLTISLIAVFLPLLLVGGVVERLFREFAITLSLAVLISAAVSLTLTPMMCARLLQAESPDHEPGALFGWSERFYDRISAGYMVGVDWVLRHRPATLGFTVLTLIATLWMYAAIPKGFLPVQDTGLLVGVMRPKRQHGTMWFHHDGQFPSVTSSFDTAPGVGIGDAIAAIGQLETTIHLPDDIRAGFRGEAGEAAKTGGRQLALFLIAVFAVYIVLGMLYESFAHPLTILSALPSAAFGALLALWATAVPFTLMTTVACILVVDMAMRNTVMMVDFALAGERVEELSPQEAILRAARLRARPIIMTTLAAALSAVPLALGTGPGHEIRQQVGIALVGGLIVSQLLTLYTTPVVYLLIDRLRPIRSGRPLNAVVDG